MAYANKPEVLVETFDYQDQFEIVKKRVKKALTKALDVQADATKTRLRATDVWVDDNLSTGDWASQKEAVRKDQTWGVPIYASVELVDRITGKVISKADKVKVATLPKPTDFGSFIIQGQHRQVPNQLRRKPGIYITEKKNGEMKTEVNVAGRPFDIEFDGAKGIFKMMRGSGGSDSSGVPLYPILSRLGVSDSALARVWGEDVLTRNKAISKKKSDEAVIRSAKYFEAGDYSTPEEAVNVIRDWFASSELRPEVTKKTVGKAYKTLEPLAILDASKSLMQAMSGERKPDDRNALEYKKAVSFSDLLGQRLLKDNGELSQQLNDFRRKIHRKINNQKRPVKDVKEVLTASQFSPVISGFFTSVGDVPDQTNPLDMINGMTRITVLGEGGITNPQRVKGEERAVHPSHLGFIDPIHTPESQKVGLMMHVPAGTMKRGEDLLTRVHDVRTKKDRWVTPGEMRDLTVGFPDQYKDGKFSDSRVNVISDGENSLGDSSKVDVILKSPQQAFSVSSNLVPFLSSIGGVRAQMATKMSEQAIPLVDPDEPLVQVGLGKRTLEDRLGDGYSATAAADGVVKRVTKDKVVIETEEGEVEHPLFNNLPLNNKSFLDSKVRVKAGDQVKQGQLLADSNFTSNGKLALGANLRAAYISYKGLNFEDGIVVTESAARKMTSEHMNKFVVGQDKTMEVSKKKFLAWKPSEFDNEQTAKLDEFGVIKKGTILKKGDPLIVGVRENRLDPDYLIMRRLGTANVKPFKGFAQTWEKDAPGEVVDVVRSGKSVKVFVRSKEPLQIGDKLTNRHGAKGIITKIISDSDAPHTADGAPVDILLNPHGIVTRINPSQVLETAAAKAAQKTGVTFKVNNFSGENYVDTVQKSLDSAGIKDKEVLYDPHSKKPLGEVLVGPQYVLKLSKQATSQFSARSEGKYDVNRQPLRGGEDGAKSMDMLTFYSMLSHGARANLREMASYKGTQNQAFWDWLQGGYKSGMVQPAPEPTFAYQKFEAYMKGAGVNMQRRGSKMVISPMTDQEIDKISNGEITDPVFLKAKNLEEERKGLMDPFVFGGRQGERWGHFNLAEPIANPVFEDAIKKVTDINKVTFDGIVSGKMFVDPETGKVADQGVTGGEAIRSMLSKVDVDAKLAELTDKAKKAKSEKQLDPINKRLKILRGLKRSKLRPEEAYVLTKVPIIPPVFRPVVELQDGTLANPGINTLYRDLGLVNNELKWQNKTPYIGDGLKQDLRRDLYKSVKAISGVNNPKPIAYYQKSRSPQGFVEQIKGKDSPKSGFFIGNVLRRQQNLVGRGTIIPDPKLGVDEVGLPEEMSWSLFEPFVMRRLVNQSYMDPNEASEEIEKRSPLAKSHLEQEMAERPVFLNRAPSLHKFSILSFKPRMVDGKAIKIPPTVVTGFNADFDGDAMTVHVPILEDAVKEANNMLPSNNLYNPGTGRIMLLPKNEAALGIYTMSKTPEGQEQIAAVLPQEAKKKWGGKVIGKNQLSSMLADVANEIPMEHGKVIDKLKAMGDEHTYRTGFTIGMKDLVPDIPEKDGIVKILKDASRKVNLSKPGDREKMTKLLNKADEELETAINKRLGEQGNSFHMMVQSGARGNMTQLKQIVSAPLVVNDHRGQVQMNPVTEPFSKGLPFSDYWRTLYGARQSVVDAQLQVSQPGAFNKDIMASSITNVIAKDDCGVKRGVTLNMKDPKGGVRYGDLEDRFLARDVKVNGSVIARGGDPVSSSLIDTLIDRKVDSLEVRSPTTCLLPEGTCSKCYGLNEFGNLPSIGDNIGATAGQSLSEPLTQMTLRSFHMGGVGPTAISGYEKVDKLFKMHEIKRGKATLATKSGIVENIKDAPGKAGKIVTLGGEEHYIEKGLWNPQKIRKGTKLTPGDIMSDGLVQPKELVKYKGMLAAQNYISSQVQEAYESQGIPMKRRNIEAVVRSVGNTTKVLDPGDSEFTYGDVAPWTVVNHYNNKSLGKMSIQDSVGHVLKEKIPGLREGSVIDEKSKTLLERSGISQVEVGPKLIRHAPFLSGVERLPMMRDDWMAQMGYRDLASAIVGGAANVSESDLHGYSPIPSFAYGAEFGADPEGQSEIKGVY